VYAENFTALPPCQPQKGSKGYCQEPNGLEIVGPPLHPQPSFEELAVRGSGSGPRSKNNPMEEHVSYILIAFAPRSRTAGAAVTVYCHSLFPGIIFI